MKVFTKICSSFLNTLSYNTFNLFNSFMVLIHQHECNISIGISIYFDKLRKLYTLFYSINTL